MDLPNCPKFTIKFLPRVERKNEVKATERPQVAQLQREDRAELEFPGAVVRRLLPSPLAIVLRGEVCPTRTTWSVTKSFIQVTGLRASRIEQIQRPWIKQLK